MRALLDTHCWLWLQAEPERLPSDLLTRLADAGTELYLSAASGWEIAIKYSLGKLPLPEPPASYVPDRMAVSGTAPLAVAHSHALAVADLPPHHRDPFDRLLVAQSRIERLTLVTADPALTAYDAELLFVG